MATAAPVTLVLGPAGIGKTTALRRLADAARPGAFVATCDDRERDLPYGVVRQLFSTALLRDPGLRQRAYAGAAAGSRVVLEAPADAPNLDPATARHALTWLVDNLAGEGQATLVVDDLQWADAASLGWILHLAHRLDDHPVRLVLAWRTDDPDARQETLDRLRDVPGTQELRPAALTRSEVADLVRRELGADTSEEVCAACAETTGGNPFLVHELLRTLGASAGREVEDVLRASSAGVARSIGRRLSRLSATAGLLAESCAVFGDGTEVHLLARVAGVEPQEAAAGVDELVAAGILAPGHAVSFLHPLVRQATYSRIAQQRRGSLHREAARAVQELGGDVAQVGNHLMSAPPRGDLWAAHQLLAAGRRALQSGALEEARRLLERALGEGSGPSLRPEILIDLGVVELQLLAPTADLRLQEVARDTSADVVLRARAAAALAASGTMDGTQPDQDLVAAIRAGLDERHRELALLLDANVLSAGILGPRRDLVLPATEALAGSTPGERLALAALAYHHVLTGEADGDRLVEIATRALADGRLVDEAGDSAAVWQATLVLIVTHADEAFLRVLERGFARTRQQNSVLGLVTWSTLACYHGWFSGDLREAEAHGQTARDAAATSDFWLPRAAAACYVSRVLTDRGRLDEADAVLSGVLDPARRSSSVYQTAAYSLMLLRTAQHRWAEVLEIADDLNQEGRVTNVGIVWRLEAAVAAAHLGDVSTAADLLEEHRRLVEHWRLPRQRGAWLRASALVQEGPGRVEGLRAAVGQLASTPARLEHARALLDLGSALRAAGERSEARTVLAHAVDAAGTCGADRLAALGVEELHAAGARPRRARTTGVHALTASELRVARLAAEGLTNPEIAQALFVTRKTVETQLSSAYRKLQIEGRRGLAQTLTPAQINV